MFRMPNNLNVYIYWNSFAPIQWKQFLGRVLCSEKHHFNWSWQPPKIEYLKKWFHNISSLVHNKCHNWSQEWLLKKWVVLPYPCVVGECPHYNLSKRKCYLYLTEKLEINSYIGKNLLNKTSTLIKTLRHLKKRRLLRYDGKDY